MAKVWKYPASSHGIANSHDDFRQSIERGKDFVHAITNGSYAICYTLLDEDQNIACRNTFSAGLGRTELYNLLGYYLETGEISNQDNEARKVIMALNEKAIGHDVESDADYNLVTDLWVNNALASDKKNSKTCWLDTVRHCIYERGMRMSSKPDFAHKPVSKEMKELWDNWTVQQSRAVAPAPAAVVAVAAVDDDSLCCICMEEKVDAIWSHCAHQNCCFTCSRDLKTCPVCRTDGYSKPLK
jgi:hypothetical protein